MNTKMILNILLIISAYQATAFKACDFENLKCEDIDDNLNSDAMDKFSKWWSEMSDKKPVKCHGVPFVESEIVKKNMGLQDKPIVDPYFESRLCNEYEKSRERKQFTFKGKIKDFKLEGPGKVKFGEMDTSGLTDDVCITRRSFFPETSFKTIVGTFIKGVPEGQVKIQFEDNSLFIGNFKYGVRHGFYRVWNSEGKLVEVGRKFMDKNIGHFWKLENDTLLYINSHVEDIQRYLPSWTDSMTKAIVIAKDRKRIFKGDILSHINILTNARYVHVQSIDVEDCFMSLETNNLEGDYFKVLLHDGEPVSYQGKRTFHPMCKKDAKWNEEDIESNLKKFVTEIEQPENTYYWNYEPSDVPVDDNAVRIISDIEHIEKFKFKVRLFGLPNVIVQMTRGVLDSENRPQGIVKFNFHHHRSPIFSVLPYRFNSMMGLMKNNLFIDTVILGTPSDVHIMTKIKDNVLHGPGLALGVLPVFPLAKEYGFEDIYEEPHELVKPQSAIGLIVNHVNGKPVGPVWMGIVGKGGFLYGHLDEKGQFTGNDMAFIYPDFKTAVYGRFEDRVMKKGQESEVIAEKCDENGIKILKFSEPIGPILYFDPPTNNSFGGGSQVQDPYEAKMAKLGQSQIPGSGEGVFAKKDIKAGTLVCPYVGYVYRNEEEMATYAIRYPYNSSLSDEERRWSKKYSIGLLTEKSQLEIPIELDVPGVWHPTLGHKINCDFPERRRNCGFNSIENPRWGVIQGVHTLKDVKAGEELFADYGYAKMDFPHDHPWYHVAKKEYEMELEMKKKKEKKKVKKTNKKHKKDKI